jgi:hypothetical protein
VSVGPRDYDREPGYYWIRVLEPICDGGGVLDEKWSEPLVGLLEDNRWWLAKMEGYVAFDVEVLGKVAPWSPEGR